MALADPVVLNDNGAVARSFYNVQVTLDGTKRIDSFPTLPTVRTMSVKHSTMGSVKGGDIADRHLLQFTYSVNDAAGKAQLLTLNCTLAVPRSTSIVRADVDHLIAFAKNFLITANVDKLLRGES
jgi:hypothetical protein